MKYDLETLPYREGVYALILNSSKTSILLVNKENSDAWGLPGGGVDNKEDYIKSLFRELEEELHTIKFRTLHTCTTPYRYDWPESEIEKNIIKKGKAMRGQSQNFYILLFEGTDSDIKLQSEELKSFAWVPLTKLSSYISYPSLLKHIKLCMNEYNLKID